MSWKALNTNNGGPLKHVASTAMLNSTKTECKKRLLEILLSNNLNLLVLICQSPLISEAGSSLPKSILKILMTYQSDEVESFIIRLLSYKARMYHIKNRDACDILRDNSFISMILNSYAHEIGYRYLTNTLSSTVKEILHYSNDLELDPNHVKKRLLAERTENYQQQLRSAPVMDNTSSISSQNEPLTGCIRQSACFDLESESNIDIKARRIVNDNIAKIENICLSLLNSIINNKEKMPSSLRHLCYSIGNVVEISYNLEYENNEVNLANMYYMSRQNSDLSMFNIMDECKTPTSEFTATPISATPISATPITATPISMTPLSVTPMSCNNFLLDDKDNNCLDTQNIYNQSIYAATSSLDHDKGSIKSEIQSNSSLNTSSSRPLSANINGCSHKKFDSYTCGIYNPGMDFNPLKVTSSTSNVSTSSNNLNCDMESEEESTNGGNKYLCPRSPVLRNIREKESLIGLKEALELWEKDSLIGLNEALKLCDLGSGNSLIELNEALKLSLHSSFNTSLNRLDGSGEHIGSNHNMNLIGTERKNSREGDRLTGSNNNLNMNIVVERRNSKERDILKQRRYNIFNNDFYSKNFKIQSSQCSETRNSLPLSDKRSILSVSENDLRFCGTNDNTSYSDDNDNFKGRILNKNDTEGSLDTNNNIEHMNKINYTIKEEEEEMLREGDSRKNSNNSNNIDSSDNREDLTPKDYYQSNTFNSKLSKFDLYGDEYNEYKNINSESLNNFATNFDNDTFLKQFNVKDNYQIKDILSSNIIRINNNNSNKKLVVPVINGIINEEARGKIMRFSYLQRELNDIKMDKFESVDEPIEKNKNDIREEENISKIEAHDSFSDLGDSMDDSKTEIDKNSDSDRPNYRRNNSENAIDENKRKADKRNDVLDDNDNIRYAKISGHVKEASQSSVSLSTRKNELGLKIETNYNKARRNKVYPLSDDFETYPSGNDIEKNKNKGEFISAKVKGSTKIPDTKGPYTSQVDNYNNDNEDNERYFVTLNDMECNDECKKGKLDKQGSGYFLTNIIEYTNAEKVVGTFLFLRFFVPAITSPENFGLTKQKITSSERKSLIICGKVLTALCNNVNFGSKEKYMEYLNPFLQVHREEAREFLRWAMTIEDDSPGPSAVEGFNVYTIESISATSKSKFENDLDNMMGKKDRYENEYSSEQSSYISLNNIEPNTPSGKSSNENKLKYKAETLVTPKKKSAAARKRLVYSADEGTQFNSMPILNVEGDESFEQLYTKERVQKSKENLNSKKTGSYKQNLKIGSVRVKHILDLDSSKNNNVRNLNSIDIKKDFELEIKDIVTFLSKNIHLLEKEIESKTSIIPLEESEGVYSGFLELKQLIFLSEDNNSMKGWFKKIFKAKYSNSLENINQKSFSKSRRSSNNNILLN